MCDIIDNEYMSRARSPCLDLTSEGSGSGIQESFSVTADRPATMLERVNLEEPPSGPPSPCISIIFVR